MKNEPIALQADPRDPEDFDVSTDGLDRGQKARVIRRVRNRLGLSQPEFARRFRVPVGTLRDWEQARTAPPDFALAYVRVIERHPEMVLEAIG
ncbi:helix-turn-helix domain-containing protein [Aureimonas phyllosphaerae]|uniref:Putative transcriptional regulator n=1 Tax=Aureimonas phyllosphaerae TaxID=1166078 RepID=A0A7W6BWZ1_9HYPH|nr:helix-turn-helix domain-containing protein [Aureimonas phyllosphaerae]MBB3936220.1 putative transcriptional regulator [Aureimonas phyllosphaerae]SFF32772.1 putative transcriptional regulator [Aureimonas phyllosphaerae]